MAMTAVTCMKVYYINSEIQIMINKVMYLQYEKLQQLVLLLSLFQVDGISYYNQSKLFKSQKPGSLQK